MKDLPPSRAKPSPGRAGSIVVPLVWILLAGCAGEGPDADEIGQDPGETGGSLTVDFERDVQPIFDRHCSCHLSVSAPQGAILLPGASYSTLVGRRSTENEALLLVEPGEADRSYLVVKLDDAVPEVRELRRGSRMPPERPPLPAGDLATIRRWIAAGAARRAQDEEPDPDVSPPLFAGVSRAEAVSGSEIDVFWTSAMDERTPSAELLYRIYVATETGAQDFAAAALVPPAGSSEARIGALAERTEYFIVVRAVDAAGNEDGNLREVSVRTLAETDPGDPPDEDRFPRDSDVERVCSGCHGLRIVLADGMRGEITPPGQGLAFFPPGFFFDAAVRSPELWAATVARMRRQNGAVLSDAEAESILRYFAENFSEPP